MFSLLGLSGRAFSPFCVCCFECWVVCSLASGLACASKAAFGVCPPGVIGAAEHEVEGHVDGVVDGGLLPRGFLRCAEAGAPVPLGEFRYVAARKRGIREGEAAGIGAQTAPEEGGGAGADAGEGGGEGRAGAQRVLVRGLGPQLATECDEGGGLCLRREAHVVQGDGERELEKSKVQGQDFRGGILSAARRSARHEAPDGGSGVARGGLAHGPAGAQDIRKDPRRG